MAGSYDKWPLSPMVSFTLPFTGTDRAPYFGFVDSKGTGGSSKQDLQGD